jgi:hypothetical protein
MDDPVVARRYLDNPLLAFREGFFTESARAMRGPIEDDPELERSRRSAVRWAAIALIVTFVGLPLI